MFFFSLFWGAGGVCAVSESADLAEAVRTVLKQEISRLFGESNPQSFNKNYLSQHSSSIPHRLAGMLTQIHTHTLIQSEACTIQSVLTGQLSNSTKISLKLVIMCPLLSNYQKKTGFSHIFLLNLT